uniref:Uncharacterized protein n=1 Tax=Opuntia streptacantha TaxID=393608 RepID=A0A7C8ZIB6_OPUST
MMRRLSTKLASSASVLLSRTTSSSAQQTLPNSFLKWALMGSVRTSRFATGFSPLEAKPLNSIMDVERAQHKSPEELASIWDDVMFVLLSFRLPYFMILVSVFIQFV